MNHLSPSQISMALRCGEQYRQRYILGKIVPPGIALLKGAGVHAGAEVNNRQKIDSHVDLPVADIVGASVARFESKVAAEGVSDYDGPPDIGAAKDGVATLSTLYAEHVAPTCQPVLVEKKIELNIGKAHTLMGVIDVVDEAGFVRDLKTTGKKKTQGEADSSIQLTTYYLAMQALTGKPPAGVALDVLIEKKKPEVQVLLSFRVPEDFQILAQQIAIVEAMIEKEVYPPNTSGWQCSPRFCGYWSDCPYVSHRVTVAAEQLKE